MKSLLGTSVSLSQRTAALSSIVVAHGVIVYAMSNGLANAMSRTIMPAVQAVFIPEDPRPLMQRVSLPAPQMKRMRVEIPPPDIEINLPAENAITDVSAGGFMMEERKAPPPPSGSAARPPLRYIMHARVGENFPNPDAFYPAASVRREEQGVVGIQVCIGVDGRLADEPMIAQSSGFPRLDEAALKLARSGRYLAGSVDGIPIVDCLQLPIRFRMKN